jgi:phage shock protein C
MDRGYALDKSNRKIMGVCAGLARITGADPLIVRLGAVVALLALGPVAVLFYFLTAWLADAA